MKWRKQTSYQSHSLNFLIYKGKKKKENTEFKNATVRKYLTKTWYIKTEEYYVAIENWLCKNYKMISVYGMVIQLKA